jgi:ABC-type amino acid transport substrate-binding protein
MSRKYLLAVAFLCFSFYFNSIQAKEYQVALVQFAQSTVDVYTNLMNAIAEETDNKFVIQVMPRARTLGLIETKQVDIIVPDTDLRNSKKQGEMKYDYSVLIYKVCYVLYTNKNKNITAAELKKGNPNKYKIEVDSAFVNSFEFDALSSTSPEGSFQKADNGTIDGFIYSRPTGDSTLKKLELKNIKRQLYAYYENKFGIQKGSKGGELDKIIITGMEKLKSEGKFDKIMEPLLKSGANFNDWQP